MIKCQGSLELAMEIQKKKKKERMTIFDFTSLVHAYLTVFMNDLGLHRKVYPEEYGCNS